MFYASILLLHRATRFDLYIANLKCNFRPAPYYPHFNPYW